MSPVEHPPGRRTTQGERALHARDRAVGAHEHMTAAQHESDRWRAVRDDAIRELLNEGWSLRAVADELGVTWSAVRYIKNRPI